MTEPRRALTSGPGLTGPSQALAPALPAAPTRLLTPSESIRRPFPKLAAVLLVTGVGLGAVGARLGSNGNSALKTIGAVTALLGACSIATWLEQRLYDKLLGRGRLLRIVSSLFLPIAALVVGPLVGALVGLLGLAVGDGGTLMLSLMLGSLWFASSSVGSSVIVLIDVGISAIIADFRSRIQAAVLSLVSIGTVGAVGVYAAARALRDWLPNVAQADELPEGIQVNFGDGPLDPQQVRAFLGQGETADLATILFVVVAAVVTLPAVLSACGKLADAVMERLNPLQIAFDEVGAGRLDVRVEEAGSRELVAIGRGFNRMTESLHETLADLERRNVELGELNRAAIRFVPFQFLELLSKRSIREIQRGDQIELEITVLFSDIRNFTTMAEGLGAKDTFRFINRYVGHMETAIHREQGFINDIYGDGIMALFHRGADAALRASIGMLHALDEFNETLRTEGGPPVRIGIGMNSGRLMLGTIGGTDRLTCTVIGDCANAAARVEGMTKLYGARLLITHESLQRLSEPARYRLRELDRVQAKGKQEPLGIYEVIDGDPHELGQAKWGVRATFADGLAQYRLGAFAEARGSFEACAVAAPGDQATQLYLERCTAGLARPADPSWNGVTRLESK